jgi:hypothetical protein
MRGTLVRRTWEHDPARYAPPRFRRACQYESFIPDELSALPCSWPHFGAPGCLAWHDCVVRVDR